MFKKYIRFIFALYTILVCLSCSDDDQLEPDFITANLNAKSWKGVPETTINAVNDTLIILGIGDEQVLGLKLKFDGVGVYQLLNTQANYYTTVGGDVITSLYTLSEGNSSQINITEYNSAENFVKGNFEVSLLKEWSNPETNNNALSFTKGRFKATIRN